MIELYVSAADRPGPRGGRGRRPDHGRAIGLARYAERVGADAIMLVPPFYDPLSFEALKVFLTDVAGVDQLPIVYYNVPARPGSG